MGIVELIEKFILVVVFFVVSFGIVVYLMFMEWKVVVWLQDCVGLDRVGFFGILQLLVDGGKMFFKEDFILVNVDKWLFIFGLGIVMFIVLIIGVVILWGLVFGEIFFQVFNVNIGIFFIMGVVFIGVYGIMIGGWVFNNKFLFFGVICVFLQMIFYELVMGVFVIIIVLMLGSFNFGIIVDNQYGFWLDGYFIWNIFKQLVVFVVFFIMVLVECNCVLFDFLEFELELIGGYYMEYGFMKFGFYFFVEYINMFILCVVIVFLFFGGYNFFGMDVLSGLVFIVVGMVVFFVKIFFLIFVFMWICWILLCFCYD